MAEDEWTKAALNAICQCGLLLWDISLFGCLHTQITNSRKKVKRKKIYCTI
jgi:hypothetical protein